MQNYKNMDVYSEEYLSLFRDILAKFVNEYDDMSQMSAIKTAKELLDTIDGK